jgi:hypothetical protein
MGSGVAFFNQTYKAKKLLIAWAEAMAYGPNKRAPDDQVPDLLALTLTLTLTLTPTPTPTPTLPLPLPLPLTPPKACTSTCATGPTSGDAPSS